MRESLVPEEAVVDAAAIDPLGAARILSILAECESPVRLGRLTDVARSEGFGRDRMENILAALSIAGLVNRQDEGLFLLTNRQEAVRHAAVLRGVAYAQYRHRDRNQVEITLSPPAHPSRLMEVLPRQGFAWAGYTTRRIA